MAYFGKKNFFEDPELLALQQRVFSGDLTLSWYDARTEKVRCTPRDPRRGFTYEDCNVGSYGYDSTPEFVRDRYSMAARGSELVPDLPDLGYTINRKSDVWAPNVALLYEEAKSRRWAPAVDLPWNEARENPLPRELEAAMGQLCTFLEEVELVLLEFPSRWIFSINQEFLELKSYLCAQMLDHARHVDAFRKRALAGGEGLKRASPTAEQALKELLCSDTYPEGSLGCNLLLGSLVFGVYRHAGAVARRRLEERLFRLAAQDTARQLAYGVAHIRYHLEHQPREAEALQEYLDRTEHALFGVAASPELFEPLVVLSGGGLDRESLARGVEAVRATYEKVLAELFARLRKAGLERRERSRLGEFLLAT
ncbi:MAG: hypothetical protein KatS3mg076_1450 [Candidatus Binatia bacterium]|nr:MAG: hypothetical protein KatS3mg076_1450 [Candidatus Binatia bacterium]